MFRSNIFAVLLSSVILASSAFYLPGVAPRSFQPGEPVPLLVNRLDSTESILPFDYYRFDFCYPGETLTSDQQSQHEGAAVTENLGQVLTGERIRHGPYQIKMMEGQTCQALCKRTYSNDDKKSIVKFKRIFNAIKKDYMQHWIVDNLPVAECTSQCRGGPNPEDQPFYRLGFPLGCNIGEASKSMTVCTINNINNMYQNDIFINNHVDIIIRYHEAPEFTGARIVGVEARPRSIKHESLDDINCDVGADPQSFSIPSDGKLDIVYTYGVFFEQSDLKWASRWDTYLRSAEGTSIHWFSIVNSLIIVLFLTGMLAVILIRTLHKDISRYNKSTDKDDTQEEFGWKLVHGDVFRAPGQAMLLSVFLGTGVQIICMTIITLVFACLGFLSPATRGGLLTAMTTLWICFGMAAGYVSSRMYKMFGGEKWKQNVIMTATLIPLVIFCIFFVLNLLLWSKGSSAAVPFTTLLLLASLWFFISVPLTFVGAYMGFKKPAIENPVRTNPIPRQIPPQSIYTRTFPAVVMGGILPFGSIFIQLFFILNSIWGHKLYYVFGFMFAVFIILAITTVESTILLCYFHLCSENYRWWWRAFLTGASSAFYLFAYEIIFYFRRMEAHGATNLFLYIGYSLIAGVVFFLLTGTVGFFGCYAFIRKIYKSVKVE